MIGKAMKEKIAKALAVSRSHPRVCCCVYCIRRDHLGCRDRHDWLWKDYD